MSNGIPTKPRPVRLAPKSVDASKSLAGPMAVQAALTAALLDRDCDCRACKALRQAANVLVNETLGGADGST